MAPSFFVCLRCYFHCNEQGIPVLSPSEMQKLPPDFWLHIGGFELLSTSQQHNVWCFVPRPLRDACLGNYLANFHVNNKCIAMHILQVEKCIIYSQIFSFSVLYVGTEAETQFPGLPWGALKALKDEREGKLRPDPLKLTAHDLSRYSRVHAREPSEEGDRRPHTSTSSSSLSSSSSSSSNTTSSMSSQSMEAESLETPSGVFGMNRALFSPTPRNLAPARTFNSVEIKREEGVCLWLLLLFLGQKVDDVNFIYCLFLFSFF